MSYDLFLFDGPFFRSPTTDIVRSDVDLQLLSDPYLPFPDPSSLSTEILHGFSEGQPNGFHQFPIETELCSSADEKSINLFSGSPPSQKLNNLSLDPTTQAQCEINSADELITCSALDMDTFGLMSEGCYVNLESSLLPTSYSSNSAQKDPTEMLQRSFSNQFPDQRPGFSYHPRMSSLMESPNFPIQVMVPPENANSSVPIRRVCSTGDLHRITQTHLNHGFSSSQLGVDSTIMEEPNFKVGKYSPEERKLRIHRYRSKRTQRNFNKTIKYACRKTLADSRPRVRGRFARNEDSGEIPKFPGLNREEEDEDDIWVNNGFQEEDEEAMIRRAIEGGEVPARFNGGFNQTQFQYCEF